MLFPASQHCVTKTKDKLSYYFYLNSHRCICYDIFSSDNRLIGKEKLGQEGTIDFSVTIDNRDNILLVCITKDGMMEYYFFNDSNWVKKTLSRLDIKSNIFGNLTLLNTNSYTHILCNKANLLNTMITSIEHIYWNEDSINKSTVTSYLSGKLHSPFQVAIDGDNNLHLLYKAFYKENNQLFYCKLNALNNRWSSCELVSNLTEDNCHPHLHIDTNNNLHMVWSTIEGSNFIIKYKRKGDISSGKGGWSEVKTLTNNNTNSLSPIIVQVDNKILILCKQGALISEIASEDFGLSWTPPNNNKAYSLENPMLIKYITNDADEKGTYNISKVFGEINQQVKVVGVNLYGSNTEIIKDEALQEECLQEIQEECEDIQFLTSPAEIPQDGNLKDRLEFEVDDNFYKLIEDVQHYINKIADEVDRFEKSRQLIEPRSQVSFEIIDSKATFDEFQIKLSMLITKIQNIEDEQLHLHNEFDDYQKKLYSIEEKLITAKKHTMELEELLNFYSGNNGIVNRFKNIFK